MENLVILTKQNINDYQLTESFGAEDQQTYLRRKANGWK